MINKRKLKLIFVALLFFFAATGLFYVYSLIQIEEQTHLITEVSSKHMGKAGEDEVHQVDHMISQDLHQIDTQTSPIAMPVHEEHEHHQGCTHDHGEGHEHTNDYAHIEWINKPFLNPIYKANLLIKTLLILIISMVLLTYSYHIDKAKVLKIEEIADNEDIK